MPLFRRNREKNKVRLPGDLPAAPPKPRFRFRSGKPKGSSQAARSSDMTIAALGVALGLICALFPWYIFLNQDKFGFPAVKLENRAPPVAEPIGSQAMRMGMPLGIGKLPLIQLDPLATGTVLRNKGGGDAAPGLDEQPFPTDAQQFRLVYVANGRAMIGDEAGLWVVQPGSLLPDSSRVSSIEQRGGKWVLVTSNDRVIEMTP
jgi:hypothetical protein